MKILYLYSEVMGYTMATIRVLAKRGIEVHVVHWDHKKLTPYQVQEEGNVYLYNRSELNTKKINLLAKKLSPTITVVSGWQDKGYLAVAKTLRKKGRHVITCLDGQYHGTLKQKIAALFGKFRGFHQFYSHAWVAGHYQFEYARRYGFKKKEIVYDFYSADLTLFNNAYNNIMPKKKSKYPHRFLFVGRFAPVKGLDILIQAWKMLGDEKADWELQLIGNGPFKPNFENTAEVIIKDFMQPDKLVQEVRNAGCFILPSMSEPWGVVVHEFAATGMPLILSDQVGAASSFLISGMNGFSYKSSCTKALADTMKRIISLSDQQLISMSKDSQLLSQRITPESSAANLLSIIR